MYYFQLSIIIFINIENILLSRNFVKWHSVKSFWHHQIMMKAAIYSILLTLNKTRLIINFILWEVKRIVLQFNKIWSDLQNS